jgi:two-component system phosphate regulon sensor histidine kinase PhoR
MRRRSLFWRIYVYFLIVTVGALAATAWFAAKSLRQFHQDQVASDLLARARIFAREMPQLPGPDPVVIDRMCKDTGRLTMTRITVILPDGRVIGDSDESPVLMENHRTRPEIDTALAGETGQSLRYSDTVRRYLMYLAVPVRQNGAEITGVVRAALPLAVMDAALETFYRQVALGGLAVAALFAVLAFFLSRRITRPLDYMRQAAEQFALGDLTARIPVPDTEELGWLSRTMNQMAAQLNERIRSLALQHNEQKAVLANMTEGVLAVDMGQRILHINPAACRLFGLKPDEGRGRHILEVVRHIALQEFIGLTLSSEGPVERDVVFREDEDRHIQLHGAALRDEAGAIIGGLVVMNDITRLKRLESMRRDFVANVSHELKTPLTTMKGCVETLSDGAAANPEEAQRFLKMMDRQVIRLEAMVDDLLVLSRLEHESERGGVELTAGSVNDVLARVVQSFFDRASKKGIYLILDCPDALKAPMNATLLEQAAGNLVDNAIKYSAEETTITVSAVQRDGVLEIRVSDQGIGMDKKHLDRIFERFYRVDQARSRAQGGTGLGLAIVKHITLAHRGSVTVASTPGQGSTFTIRLPVT